VKGKLKHFLVGLLSGGKEIEFQEN